MTFEEFEALYNKGAIVRSKINAYWQFDTYIRWDGNNEPRIIELHELHAGVIDGYWTLDESPAIIKEIQDFINE